MKRDLNIMDKRNIVLDVLIQNKVQMEKNQRKQEICNCLQLMGIAGQPNGVSFFQHKLADWLLANYFQLKTNPQMILHYGNLKFLSKQSKDFILALFKKCQQKLGDCMNQNDLYSTMLMKNPYMNYQPLAFMYPPYGMPTMPGMSGAYSGLGTNMENYQKMYNIDMQQYYMQMSKYGYPINPMYMPPMPIGMPKYDGSQNSTVPNKNYYSPYPVMAQQSQIPPQQIKLKTASITPPPPTSRLRSGQQSSKPHKQTNMPCQPEHNQEAQKRNKQKLKKQLPKNAPFIIIPPHMQKFFRQQIPQKLYPSQKNTNNIQQNHQSSEIQIVQKPQQFINEGMKQKKNLVAQNNQNINKNYSNIINSANLAINNKKLQEQKFKKYQKDIKFNLNSHMGMQYRDELRFCACTGYGTHPQTYICTDCSKKYHYYCTQKKNNNFKITQQNREQCHFCFMKSLDPLNKVQIQIKTSYVLDIKRNKFTQIIDFELYDSYISKTSPYEIQVRCLRMEDASNYVPEYTWPDQCLVTLNQQRTIQFQALQHNSSLKKRKDMSIFLTNYIYFYNRNLALRKHLPVGLQIKDNTVLQVSQKKIRNNYIFVFGVYLVLKKTPDQLTDQILKDSTNKVNFAQKFFSEVTIQDDIQIEQIKVTLVDPFTWNVIDVPARGRKCTHCQCFDLKTFLSFMNVQKVRQWKCPVCNKQCRNFTVDTQQMQAIKQFKKHQSQGGDKKLSKQIQFHRDGTTLFVAQKQEQQDDQKQHQQSKKTKLIAKAPKSDSKQIKQPQKFQIQIEK